VYSADHSEPQSPAFIANADIALLGRWGVPTNLDESVVYFSNDQHIVISELLYARSFHPCGVLPTSTKMCYFPPFYLTEIYHDSANSFQLRIMLKVNKDYQRDFQAVLMANPF
jgi:hypothetical protein